MKTALSSVSLALSLGFANGLAATTGAMQPAVIISQGFSASGEPTELWRQAVRQLRGATVVLEARPLTNEEASWLRLIGARAGSWPGETGALLANFPGIEAPTRVRVLVGNQGAEDAFVFDRDTIAFDLGRLAAVYGDASAAENSQRIDRLFRHEYVHLLQKRWLAQHPFKAERPLDRALLGMWSEGLGNYYSLSAKWRSADGRLSPAGRAAVKRLSPLLVARLAGLSCSSSATEGALSSDLSMGPFEDKWGALPVALWLAEESAASPSALRQFVSGGPAAVWELLDRRLDPVLARVLIAARAQDRSCAATPAGPAG